MLRQFRLFEQDRLWKYLDSGLESPDTIATACLVKGPKCPDRPAEAAAEPPSEGEGGLKKMLPLIGDGHPVRRLRAREAPLRRPGHQTDNGSEFGSSFHYHLLDKGVGHKYIKPRTPRLNGKVERSHRIDAEEFYRLLDGAVIDYAKVFNHKLQEWEDYYNYDRPHGGLGGQTPYERLKQKTQARV